MNMLMRHFVAREVKLRLMNSKFVRDTIAKEVFQPNFKSRMKTAIAAPDSPDAKKLRARDQLKLLQAGANYICIRMQVEQIQYQHANMTLHNLDHNTHQKPLLESIIATVAGIYSILDDFTDGASLQDLPRALKARSEYVKQISTTCTNALDDPSQLPAIFQAMASLIEVMGNNMIEYQRQH
jgi:hypothetical protein